MELKQIEILLFQEMEEVKGGRSGSCTCQTGAFQIAPDPGESCFCNMNGAQQK